MCSSAAVEHVDMPPMEAAEVKTTMKTESIK